MKGSRRQVRTGDYPQAARQRLADAVVKARTAAGYQYRTDFADAAKAAGEKLSRRSMQALELDDASVGQSVLFAVARLLPNWTEDTPRAILEGDPIPANEPAGEAVVPAPDGHWPTDAEIIAMTTRDMARFSIKIEDKSGWQAAEDWLFHALTVRRDAKRNLAVPQSG